MQNDNPVAVLPQPKEVAKPKSDVAIANEHAESVDQLRRLAQRQWQEIGQRRAADDAEVARMTSSGFGVPSNAERSEIMQARWDSMQLHVDSLKAFVGDVGRWIDEVDAMIFKMQELFASNHDRAMAEHCEALPMQKSVAREAANANPTVKALRDILWTCERRRGVIDGFSKDAQAAIQKTQNEMAEQSKRWRVA